MKKILRIVVLLIVLLFIRDNKVAAKSKPECFDIDYVVNLMPGISRVDTLLMVYERDSLGQQYQEFVREYRLQDSLMMVRHSGIRREESELKRENDKRFRTAYILQNWQQYSQQALLAKWQELTQPFQIKVINAFQTVVKEERYAIGCGDTAFWKSLSAVKLHIQVIQKLGLTVPKELLQQLKRPN